MISRKATLAAWVMAASSAAIPGLARAQVGGLPGGGASSLFAPSAPATSASALGAAATAAPAAQPTLAGFLGFSKPHLAQVKQKFCASPYGSLMNNGLGPLSTLTGGLIPQCCPTVPSDSTIAALAAANGPNGAETVAAKVKQDEAEAKARRAAIRYLATVDCHYWPEAEVAIISGLRDDRNECVRYEAALALLNGCCCNARTIEALNIVVSGSEKDGKPSETSDRVRAASLAALQGCLLRSPPAEPPPPEKPEPPEPARSIGALDPAFRRVSYYYRDLAVRPTSEVFADARKTVARAVARPHREEQALPGEHSVYHAIARAKNPAPPTPPANLDHLSAEDLRPVEAAAVVSTPRDPKVAQVRASSRKGLFSAIARNAPLEDSALTRTSTSPQGGRGGLFGIIRNSIEPDPNP